MKRGVVLAVLLGLAVPGTAEATTRTDVQTAARLAVTEYVGTIVTEPNERPRVRVWGCHQPNPQGRWRCKARVAARDQTCRMKVLVATRKGKYLVWVERLRCRLDVP